MFQHATFIWDACLQNFLIGGFQFQGHILECPGLLP